MRALLLTALCLGFYARADYQVIDAGDDPKKDPFFTSAPAFRVEDPKSIAPNTIKYSYRLQEFAAWNSADKKVLNLFEQFKARPDRPLIVYIAKASTIIEKPADQINMRPFITINALKSVDMKIQALPEDKVITYTEEKSSYRNPPAPAKWCGNGDANNLLCTFTRFVLPGDFQAALNDEAKAHNSKYSFLDAQGESRIYSGADIANANDLTALTGIVATKPSSVAVQSAFWFTHIVGFAKNIFVFQPNPAAPNQTLLTVYMVYAIEHKAWDREKDLFGVKVKLSEFFLSKSALNDEFGIAQGLPKYTKKALVNLMNVIAR